MIVIKVVFEIPADQIETGKAAFISRQDEVTAEEGCISFRMYQDLENPGKFFLFEEWESQAALEAHWANAHLSKAPKWPERIGETIAMRYEVAAYGNLRN